VPLNFLEKKFIKKFGLAASLVMRTMRVCLAVAAFTAIVLMLQTQV